VVPVEGGVNVVVTPAVGSWEAVVLGIAQTWPEAVEGWRWRNDDEDEANATWKDLQDVIVSIAVDGTGRLRIVWQAPQSAAAQLEAAVDGTEDWFKVENPD
jgi:hypothetical protein